MKKKQDDVAGQIEELDEPYKANRFCGEQYKEDVEKIVLKIMRIASNKTFAAAQRATGERHCSRPKWQNYATV